MGREEIVKWINGRDGENYKNVLSFCQESKEFNVEAWNKALNLNLTSLIDILKNMKAAGALEFSDGKYTTTKTALDLL